MLDLIAAGGWVMLPILLCSAMALAITLERAWALRTRLIIPPRLVKQMPELVRAEFDASRVKALRADSPLGRILAAALASTGDEWSITRERIEEAIDLARHLDPDLLIDGPMQGNTALDPEAMAEYPFMAFDEPANVLICPNLAAANIAYKLLENLADVEMIGPILEGLNRPVQVVARTDGVRHIANMAAICALDSLRRGD